MSASIILMTNTGACDRVVGDPQHADGWYSMSDGNHTVSIHPQNIQGRVWIQATLALEPQEEDWFDIWLTPVTPFLEFPINPSNPTGANGGDSQTVAFKFRANVLWIRAIMDR